MQPLRKTSLIFGLFFAGTFLFSIPALFFYDPLFKDAAYLLQGGFDTRISTGALFEILLSICNIATAIVLYPLVRRVSPSGSLGYVASRTVESVLILSGVISLMAIMSVRTGFDPTGDPHDLLLAKQMLMAYHDWTFLLGPQFCSGFGNGLVLGYLMYKSEAMPRSLSLMGLIGGPLAFIGGILVLYDVIQPLSPALFGWTALEIIWELTVTTYAIFFGFRAIRQEG